MIRTGQVSLRCPSDTSSMNVFLQSQQVRIEAADSRLMELQKALERFLSLSNPTILVEHSIVKGGSLWVLSRQIPSNESSYRYLIRVRIASGCLMSSQAKSVCEFDALIKKVDAHGRALEDDGLVSEVDRVVVGYFGPTSQPATVPPTTHPETTATPNNSTVSR